MKILSFVLSMSMLVNSIPCSGVYAGSEKEESEFTQSQQVSSPPPPTTDNFKEFVDNPQNQLGLPYVDKSLFIKAIIEDNTKAILITQPRRWGKSLNLSMLKYFFIPEVDETTGQKATRSRNRLLFSELNINNQFLDTREILNRLLFTSADVDGVLFKEKDVDDIFFENTERAADMSLSAGALEALVAGLRKQTITLPEEHIEHLKGKVKEYGKSLVRRFEGVNDLPSLLSGLNQLYGQIRKLSNKDKEDEKRELTKQYNAKFEDVRQQIESHINMSPALGSELRKEFDLVNRHQGHHPTILLSLKDTKEDTYQNFENQLRLKISQVFGEYPYILNGLYKQSKDDSDYAKQQDALTSLNKFNSLRSQTSPIEILKDSLSFLSKLLYDYHGKKAYVLIDEYDAAPNHLLFKEAITEKDIQPVAKLISDILSPLCKGNEFVEKVILTGVFDTLYKEAGSGLNNVVPYSVLDEKFSSYYGFSESEIKDKFIPNLFPEILPAEEMILMGQLKEWYNGYTDRHLYTPWAVVRHLKSIIDFSKDGHPNYSLTPQGYWDQSGAKDSLEKIGSISKKLESLSNADMEVSKFLLLRHPYQERITPHSISSIFSKMEDKAEVLRYVLINFGYLTAKGGEIVPPNREVKDLYNRHFESWVRSIGLDLSPFDISSGEEYSKRMKSNLNVLAKSLLVLNEREIQSIVDMLSLFPNMLQYTFGQQATLASIRNAVKNKENAVKLEDTVGGGKTALDSIFFPKKGAFLKEGGGDTAIISEFKYSQDSSKADKVLTAALLQLYSKYMRHVLMLVEGLPEYEHIKNIKAREGVFIKAASNDNTGGGIDFKMKEWTHTIAQSKKLRELFKGSEINAENLHATLKKHGVLSYQSQSSFHTFILKQAPLFDGRRRNGYEGLHEGQPVRFREHAVVEDGDCGFHGLGINRAQGLQQLLSTTAPEVRDMVVDDMFEALMAHEFPEAALDEELSHQRALYQRTSYEKDRLLLRASLFRPEVYQSFLKAYLGGNGWLSYVRGGRGILNALARLNNINVFVWTPGQTEQTGQKNQLKAVHAAVQSHPQNTVHLLHTHGMTHFNLLEIDEEASGEEVVQRINFLASAVINNRVFFDDKWVAQRRHYLETGIAFETLRRSFRPLMAEPIHDSRAQNVNVLPQQKRHAVGSPGVFSLSKVLFGIKHLIFKK